MTRDVYELFDGLDKVQSWDINTMLHLCCCFIGSRQARVDLFRDFLKEVADIQNGDCVTIERETEQ